MATLPSFSSIDLLLSLAKKNRPLLSPLVVHGGSDAISLAGGQNSPGTEREREREKERERERETQREREREREREKERERQRERDRERERLLPPPFGGEEKASSSSLRVINDLLPPTPPPPSPLQRGIQEKRRKKIDLRRARGQDFLATEKKRRE
jgi:hypothetical protein